MFYARSTLRLGWPLAMAVTVAAVRAVLNRLETMPLRPTTVEV
jgi:hypothetical protein